MKTKRYKDIFLYCPGSLLELLINTTKTSVTLSFLGAEICTTYHLNACKAKKKQVIFLSIFLHRRPHLPKFWNTQ
jgi:hypothetical protein